MAERQPPRGRTIRLQMEQGGWQPPLELPKLEVRHHHDPIAYLLIPLLGYLFVCAVIAAVLVHEIGLFVPW